jgi:RHS repeat-associated protein
VPDKKKRINYYPFGLKHKGYNNVVSSNGNSTAQKWGYQGQELTEDLGLNLQEFKFRMHDPAIGRFISIDPLAEDYSYQSPYNFSENRVIEAVEIEGLEAFFIHGTWSDPSFMTSSQKDRIKNEYQNKQRYSPDWTGDNTSRARVAAANKIAEFVIKNQSESTVTLVGHSHGGNVAILAANIISDKLGGDVKINLLTINTPVRDDYQLDEDSGVEHINVYNNSDVVQKLGGTDGDGKKIGIAGRKFKNTFNIKYSDAFNIIDDPECAASGHCGTSERNIDRWLPSVSGLRNVRSTLRQFNNTPNHPGSAGSADDHAKKKLKDPENK